LRLIENEDILCSEWAVRRNAHWAGPQKEGVEVATKSLYVGNLPYNTTEDELRSFFETHGVVEQIRVIQSKGFGFVDVLEEDMEAIIEATNGQELGGRAITVNEARPREERPARGGGRSGGGFGGGGRDGW